MNLTELIHKLKKEGDKLYSWYLVETNVESVSDLEKTGEGFFLNFKLKDKHVDENELEKLAEEYRDTWCEDMAVKLAFKEGYRKAKME